MHIASGDNWQGPSGTSLAYYKRNEISLHMHKQMTGEQLVPYRASIEWGAILSQD